MSTCASAKLIQSPLEYVNGAPWYALVVRGRYEKAVASNLRAGGYDAFVPLHTCAHRWSDRIQTVELPLFPNYVFCRCDVRNKIPILNIPGVIHFVAIGKKPEPVDESEMNALQTVIRSGMLLRPWPFLRVGQRVVVQEGPLRNIEGLLANITDQDQLIVNITLLQRSVGVTIERSWIRPLDDPQSSHGARKKGPASENAQAFVLQQHRSA
jgi:transcriptional antiterminator NusG